LIFLKDITRTYYRKGWLVLKWISL